ncbi:T9SS type A sorting domain-containing protein, partial [Flavobacteriales bacterium]|nr:T9SS type A sorting domain-containing protein [Flavobacteriales bacterium]
VVDPIGQNYPYSEGFENASSLPDANWYIENTDGSANKWELSTAAAATGTNSAVMKNLGNNKDQVEALVSSSIDLSQLQTAEFSFKYAYAQNGTSVDRIRLYFSTDCGESWSLGWLGIGSIIETLGSPISSEFIPTSSQWNTHNLNITSGLLVEGFLYKFELESDSGNQFYVDDINITGTYKAFPVLESPVDGAGNLSDNPVLNWKSVESCAEYEYQLDVNSSFSSGALQTGTKAFISSNPDGVDTEFQTSALTHGQTYFWRVRSKTNGIPSAWSETWEFTVSQNGVGFEEMFSPSKLNVRVIPNPVSSEAWVNFNAVEGEVINITVLNLLGKEVKSIYKGETAAGNQSVPFTTEQLPSGVYFVKLQTSSGADLSKFIVK